MTGRESIDTLGSLSFQPGPGGKRKDHPELFFPRGLTPLFDSLESRPCPMYLIGTGVRDASRMIEPRNPSNDVTF